MGEVNSMRLIDADRLKEEIVEAGQGSTRYRIGEFWELNRDEIWKVINEQPTVEERKNGRWQVDPSGYGFWICSDCGFVSEASGADLLYNFCPNCGADMRGEQDD